MKKLTLDLDQLRVDSFEASPVRRSSRGTVEAFDSDTDAVDCLPDTSNWRLPRGIGGTQWGIACTGTNPQGTNAVSCYGTCDGPSCGGTCYEASCGGTCYGEDTCNPILCIPF